LLNFIDFHLKALQLSRKMLQNYTNVCQTQSKTIQMFRKSQNLTNPELYNNFQNHTISVFQNITNVSSKHYKFLFFLAKPYKSQYFGTIQFHIFWSILNNKFY